MTPSELGAFIMYFKVTILRGNCGQLKGSKPIPWRAFSEHTALLRSEQHLGGGYCYRCTHRAWKRAPGRCPAGRRPWPWAGHAAPSTAPLEPASPPTQRTGSRCPGAALPLPGPGPSGSSGHSFAPVRVPASFQAQPLSTETFFIFKLNFLG